MRSDFIVLISILTLASVQLSASEAYSDFEPLLSVNSSYLDSSGKSYKVDGVGSLIEADGHFFVLTASHVSGGSPNTLEIKKQGQGSLKLKLEDRMADVMADVEIIEVANVDGLKPLASRVLVDGQYKWKVNSSSILTVSPFTVGPVANLTDGSKSAPYILLPKSKKCSRSKSFQTQLSDESPSYERNWFSNLTKKFSSAHLKQLIASSWVEEGTFENRTSSSYTIEARTYNYLTPNKYNNDPLKMSYFGKSFSVEALIAPGMSGSPVIFNEYLQGVAIQYDRQSFHSYAASVESLNLLVDKYLNHKRWLNDFQWIVESGDLQRVAFGYCLTPGQCGSLYERSSVRKLTGGEDSGSGGSGGSGAGSDSGGVKGDGGSLEVSNNNESVSNINCETLQGFERLPTPPKLQSGLIFNGRRILGFELSHSTKDSQTRVIYLEANIASLRFLKTLWNNSEYSIKSVFEGDALMQLLRAHLNLSSESMSAVDLLIDDSFWGHLKLKLDHQTQTISLRLPTPLFVRDVLFRNKYTFIDQFIEVSIGLEGEDSKPIASFQPIYYLLDGPRGKLQYPYYVDIRGLFFLDLYNTGELSKDPINNFDSMYDLFIKGPTVSIRTATLGGTQYLDGFGYSLFQFIAPDDN